MSCQRARSARASTPRSANSRKTAIGGVASNNQARSFQSSCRGCRSSPAMGSSFDGLVVQCILPAACRRLRIAFPMAMLEGQPARR